MNIWKYQRTIIRGLLQWSLLSLVAGFFMLPGRRFWREMGKQFVGWGIVNMGIVYVGMRMSEERRAALPDPNDAEIVQRETESLRRLLEVNTLLDVVYMAGGRVLMLRGSRGSGLGILIQGTFLFLFDLFHARNVPNKKP